MTTVTPTEPSNTSTAAARPERFDVVVIGAGQAGLSTGYYLAKRGLHHLILEAHPRVGDSWRTRWDSLRLFTPTRYNSLPEMKLHSEGQFPAKDELADYFQAYADAFSLPVRTSTTARRVMRSSDGAGTWLVETDSGLIEAESVVIATGGYQEPKVPTFASELDPDIVQVHSHDYRNQSQLKPGPVLVVGASNSGAEIAIEAAQYHPTILSGRNPGEIPFRIERPVAKVIFPVLWFAANWVLTVDTPPGRKLKPLVRAHGGPLVRIKHSDLEAAGVEYSTARTTGVQDGKPMLEDGRVLNVANVIWCTGFHGDFSWIHGLTYGDDGYPEQDRGLATGAPGLYFAGLKFQRSMASMLVGGAGRDAKHIVDHMAARVRQAA